MTTSTDRDEALARLREIVKPGDRVVFLHCGSTRSGNSKFRAYAAERRVTVDIADALRLTYRDDLDPSAHAVWPGDRLSTIPDALSVALFGEPGQIRGEYL